MGFLLTLVLTFLLIFSTLLYFLIKGPPVYRVERVNVIRLLELVVAGQAEVSDWDVFIGYPIRHDLGLADIQRRCIAIGEREYLGGKGKLFTKQGVAELEAILDELRKGV